MPSCQLLPGSTKSFEIGVSGIEYFVDVGSARRPSALQAIDMHAMKLQLQFV
jgi:hypothetical protein